ncbi:MAG: hypothetical protein J2P57_05725 [Acidimicrobiaceae bacterium]|nr:hypothetical protein [Acidimicrobiaceae bacterium]
MHSLLAFTSDTLTIRPWADEVIERLGFDPRSAYVERFWLGIVGPSGTWLLRRLAAGFDQAPEGYELPLGDTARAIGLGDRNGRNSPFLRTVNRLLQFDLAQSTSPSELWVRKRVPPLNQRQLTRLPPAMQDEHARWQASQLREPAADAQRRRGRQLALSLFELGEDLEEAERQLLRWRYHPAMAREAAAWAWERHQSALAAAAG